MTSTVTKKTHSAGGVVVNKKGQVLIVNQRGKSWSLPKGHVETGEETLAAARREIYEESGLSDLEYLKPLGTYERQRIGLHGGEDGSETKVLTFFLFHCEGGTPRPIDPDNPEARWVEKNEVAKMLTHPKDREFFLNILKEIS
jgi:ADP-ribose pyrophosphatase YjhB (NUDIX family)